MKRANSAGFTIIEVILFLAISGVMSAGILAGVTVSINQQKYKDAVSSLSNDIQAEFSKVFNVENSPLAAGTSCDSTGIHVDSTSSAQYYRGQSDCAIIGRLITINPEGTKLSSQAVLSTKDITTSTVGATEKETLQSMVLVSSTVDESNYELEWGTSIADESPNQANKKQFTLLIVRSPTTGYISMYSSTSATASIDEVISHGSASKTFTLCVDSGGLMGGPQGAAKILEGATSASSVHTISGSPCGDN